MKTLKRLLLLAVATLAVIALIVWTIGSFGFGGPLAALLINWLAMSWMAVVGQLVHLSFAPVYYRPRRFERDGRVYEVLGIRFFKKLVRRGPLAILSPTLRFPAQKTQASLQALDAEMRNAETGHVIVFLLVLAYVAYLLLAGWPAAAAWNLLFDVLINGYPIMLQRYNRIKLHALIDELPEHSPAVFRLE